MARLAWKSKDISENTLIKFIMTIKSIINDKRRYVAKAIILALKKIGTRNIRLKNKIKNFCKEIEKNSPSIANEVLRYLKNKCL
ncbi:MAG: hypothetical protein Q6363_003090 [Candidatus Njordarchaeota archaeon]